MAGATGEVEAGLRLQLLGGFRVWVDGQPIDAVAWERRLSASLVKLLALAPGHRLHREQVIESLWPAAEPATVRNRLDQTVHLARRSLITGGVRAKASAYLAQHHEHVLLAPGVPLQVDVDTFEAAARSARQHSDPAALEAALALGRGELLPDDPYEAWLVGRREALRQLRFELLRALAARYRAGGRAPAAITALQRLLAAEPADEAAHCALMRLYTSTGERHLALQQYQRLTEALRRELDAAPSTASQQLYQAILAEQPSVTAPTPPPATPSFTGSSRPTNRHVP